MPGGRLSSVISHNYGDPQNNSVYYFDHTSGLIIYSGTHARRMPDKSTELVHSNYYIGPDGISEIPGEELGRFIDPMTHRARLIFDRKLRRFFSVDFEKMKVKKGPEIGPDDKRNPLQIQTLAKNAHLHINVQPPAFKVRIPDKELEQNQGNRRIGSSWKTVPAIVMTTGSFQYALVLDETGMIDLLDIETLRFAGPAGYLIAPKSLYQSGDTQYAAPEDLLSYKIRSVAIGKDHRNLEHRGICVSPLSSLPPHIVRPHFYSSLVTRGPWGKGCLLVNYSPVWGI